MKSSHFLSTLKKWVFNKYVITLLVFIFVLTFCGPNSLVKRIQVQRKIHALEQEIDTYNKKIDANQQKINELETNKDNLEKFAREQYLMKEDGEDIYLVDEEK